MQNNLLERLIEAGEQLKKLKAVACRMNHERVLIDRTTHLPVAGTIADIEFERIGLCDSVKRFKNPACGHTMARYEIENALEIMRDHDGYRQWCAELNNLTNSIHLLDHQKGEAEKQLAVIIKGKHEAEFDKVKIDSPAQKLPFIKRQIAEMEQRHSVYAAQIEDLKNNILEAVNSLIEIEKNKTI